MSFYFFHFDDIFLDLEAVRAVRERGDAGEVPAADRAQSPDRGVHRAWSGTPGHPRKLPDPGRGTSPQ